MTMLSAFRSLQSEFANAQPDMGHGVRGWCPPAGIRECDIIVGYSEDDKDVEFKYKDYKAPGIRLSLTYRTHEDPALDEPKNWKSASFLLPVNAGAVPEDARWIAERTLKRLLGFITCLLGPGHDVSEGWDAVKNMIDASNNSGNYMLVRVNNRAELDSKTKKPSGYMTDFLQEVIDTVSLDTDLGNE